MNRRAQLVWLAAIIVAVAAVIALVGSHAGPLRIWIGLPLVVLLPGDALTRVIDPGCRMGPGEWFATAIGGSLSIAVLLGLAIAKSPWGLAPQSWLLSLCAVTLMLLAAAGSQIRSTKRRKEADLAGASDRRFAAVLVVSLLLGGTATLFAALTPTTTPVSAGDVLQLWALPAKTGQDVRVGVENLTGSASRYRLSVSQGSASISRQTLDMPVGSDYVLDIPASTIKADAPVVAVLSDSNQVALRRVSIWPPAANPPYYPPAK